MKNTISTTLRGRTTALMVLASVVLAALFLGSLLMTTTQVDDATGSASGASGSRPVVTAAVVNEDVPVEVEGQTVPLGRQLSGALVNSDDPDVSWVLSNREDAREGLASGEYSVLATIPKDFSATASSGATGPPGDARSARITVENSPVAKAADASTAKRLIDSSLHEVGSMVTESYLDTVFVGFNDMHDQLGEASDGASQLADGTGELADGAGQLSDGSAQLSDGLGELSAGGSELSDGLSQLEEETAAMPGQTARLADGAGQVADGVHELQTTAAPGLASALAALDRLPEGVADVPELQQARDELTTLQEQLGALDSGARQVAEGTQALDDGSAQLVDAVGQASSGARQLSDGLVEADDASGDLADGASQLTDGATEAHDGASDLSAGLASAVDQVPTYPDEDRGTLSNALATPVDGAVSSSPDDGTLRQAMLVLSVVFLLAAAAAVYFQLTRALPRDIVTTSGSTARILRSGLVTRQVLSAAVALTVTVLAAVVLSLSAGATVAVFAVSWVGAVMLILVTRALCALFPRGGVLVALTAAVLGVLGGVTSLVPGPVAGLVAVLPSGPVAGALRGILNADAGAVGTGVAGAVVWAGIAAAVVWVAANRRRVDTA